MNKSLQYNTPLFTDIWSISGAFVHDLTTSEIVTAYGSMPITSINAQTLYWLLYARYGNNPIANTDIKQFQYKVYSIIFQYGPTWQKRLEIQSKVRSLSEDDIIAGGKAIYNQAFNPSTEPGTGTLEELDYINAQNTTNYKKSKLEAYSILTDLLKTDVTEQFLDKFKICFKTFVMPEKVLVYVDDDESEGE
jgi:hypothetical protein